MKRVTVSRKKLKSISIEPPRIEEVFDVSALETIDHKTVVETYREFFTKHKKAMLNLALSRVALDSAMKVVDESLAKTMSGTPVQLHDPDSVEKLDDAFTKTLMLYALDCALSEFIPDQAQRLDYVQQFATQRIVAKPSPQMPLATSSANLSNTQKAVNRIEELLKQQTGIEDNAPSPYGVFNKPDNKDNRKLPTAKAKISRRKDIRR